MRKVISVSRRTDIPAFFSEWFLNGIKRGYVDSINPFNRKYVSRVSLKPDDVICFVFWTKDPAPLMKHLSHLDDLGYKYYFQFTLNPYDTDIESHVPSKSNQIIETFQTLSKQIGKEKVIWRYDPILINSKYTIDYHIKYFDALSNLLKDYTNQVVVSFIDLYQKTTRNTVGLDIKETTINDIEEIASRISHIAKKHGLPISTCSETFDLEIYGINHGKCIDDDLIRSIVGVNYNIEKDKGQRKACGCVSSIDIGTNNTCRHYCRYCYANTSVKTVEKNYLLHDPYSSLLCGELKGDETIHWRNGIHAKGIKDSINQIKLDI